MLGIRLQYAVYWTRTFWLSFRSSSGGFAAIAELSGVSRRSLLKASSRCESLAECICLFPTSQQAQRSEEGLSLNFWQGSTRASLPSPPRLCSPHSLAMVKSKGSKKAAPAAPAAPSSNWMALKQVLSPSLSLDFCPARKLTSLLAHSLRRPFVPEWNHPRSQKRASGSVLARTTDQRQQSQPSRAAARARRGRRRGTLLRQGSTTRRNCQLRASWAMIKLDGSRSKSFNCAEAARGRLTFASLPSQSRPIPRFVACLACLKLARMSKC